MSFFRLFSFTNKNFCLFFGVTCGNELQKRGTFQLNFIHLYITKNKANRISHVSSAVRIEKGYWIRRSFEFEWRTTISPTRIFFLAFALLWKSNCSPRNSFTKRDAQSLTNARRASSIFIRGFADEKTAAFKGGPWKASRRRVSYQ